MELGGHCGGEVVASLANIVEGDLCLGCSARSNKVCSGRDGCGWWVDAASIRGGLSMASAGEVTVMGYSQWRMLA